MLLSRQNRATQAEADKWIAREKASSVIISYKVSSWFTLG